MRNLFLFLLRHYFFLLFIILEIFSFYLIVQHNHFHRSHFLNSSSTIVGNILSVYNGIISYFKLKQNNEKLMQENIVLRNILYGTSSFNKTDSLFPILDSMQQQYIYIGANVVRNSVTKLKNFITLDVGAQNGVKPGMGVCSAEGVVGIVRDVSPRFSVAMSVLHKDTRIPVTIKKFHENSILRWDGANEHFGWIERIPSHLSLSIGDTVVTSQYSSVFPPGIPVGTIADFTNITGNTFYEVKIRFSVNFNRLSYVYVINNRLQQEQEELEKRVP